MEYIYLMRFYVLFSCLNFVAYVLTTCPLSSTMFSNQVFDTFEVYMWLKFLRFLDSAWVWSKKTNIYRIESLEAFFVFDEKLCYCQQGVSCMYNESGIPHVSVPYISFSVWLISMTKLLSLSHALFHL